jgi:epoxyqueuosine reductase QueG
MAISERRRARAGAKVDPAAELEAYARSIGADVFGVAAAGAFEQFPHKPQPSRFVPDARSVVIVGVANTPELFASVGEPEKAVIVPKGSEYAGRGDDIMDLPPAGAERYYLNDEVAQLTNEVMLLGYKVSWKLRREGYRAFYITPFLQDNRFRTAAFHLMPAMYLAGMGQMGMNCSIITPEFGPRIWVTGIITNKELPAGGPVGPAYREECEKCLKCVRACPSGALDGSRWKNVFRCASYGCCGTCLSVCPQGKGN